MLQRVPHGGFPVEWLPNGAGIPPVFDWGGAFSERLGWSPSESGSILLQEHIRAECSRMCE
jgi:hypothetical protein